MKTIKWMLQVDLDVEAAQSITDSAGFITKEDFMKFAKDRNLVDFNDRKDKDDTPKKEWAPQNKSSKVVIVIQKNREMFSYFAAKLYRVALLLWWDSKP